MKKILIIGAGAMGSAFSIPCAENNNDVTIMGSVLEDDFISSIKSNKNLHPSLNVILPKNIKIEKFSAIVDRDLDLIVVAVSSRTGTIIANKNIKEAQKIQNFIQTEYYKCEISDDIEGIEISSAIKNLYSMLIGGSQGLSNPAASKEIQEKYFLNTAASLIHRSISEMVEIVNSYSGKTESVYGLAGLGDIYVSVSGGRNSQMGKYLGQGYLYKEAKEKFMKNTTVEGAQLAFDIGPKLMAKFDKRKFPLLFSILECICENKKLQIDW